MTNPRDPQEWARETPAELRSGESAMDDTMVAALRAHVPDWRIVERDGVAQLERTFAFRDFAQALAFTDAVGALAEAAQHHPAILTEWGKTTVTWWTHTVKGLHRNDFIMAARTDGAYEPGGP